jgi:hypothetical protein
VRTTRFDESLRRIKAERGRTQLALRPRTSLIAAADPATGACGSLHSFLRDGAARKKIFARARLC